MSSIIMYFSVSQFKTTVGIILQANLQCGLQHLAWNGMQLPLLLHNTPMFDYLTLALLYPGSSLQTNQVLHQSLVCLCLVKEQW